MVLTTLALTGSSSVTEFFWSFEHKLWLSTLDVEWCATAELAATLALAILAVETLAVPAKSGTGVSDDTASVTVEDCIRAALEAWRSSLTVVCVTVEPVAEAAPPPSTTDAWGDRIKFWLANDAEALTGAETAANADPEAACDPTKDADEAVGAATDAEADPGTWTDKEAT